MIRIIVTVYRRKFNVGLGDGGFNLNCFGYFYFYYKLFFIKIKENNVIV